MTDFEVTGEPHEFPLAGACPGCAKRSMRVRTVEHEVAYFGRTLETTVRCDECGFRHADFLVLAEHEPVRLTLRVTSEDHLFARVIRSISGTWAIPELGFRAEPTAASEAFVTNVEGMLDRAHDVLRTAREFYADEPSKRDRADELLGVCVELQEGRRPFSLVLEDPFGNSAIHHADVEREVLSAAEAEELSPGMVLFDKDEIETKLGGA